MYSGEDTAEAVGCPIRTSMDQSLFAAPHGFSQRTTSFIASQRQGIHQMPLRRLIALISQCPNNPDDAPWNEAPPQLALIRNHRHWKDQLQGFASPPLSRRACGQARPAMSRTTLQYATPPAPWHGKSNPFFTMSKIISPSRQSDRQILSLSMGCRLANAECNRRPGGARRDRTDDLLLAKQALSQLSYGPG